MYAKKDLKKLKVEELIAIAIELGMPSEFRDEKRLAKKDYIGYILENQKSEDDKKDEGIEHTVTSEDVDNNPDSELNQMDDVVISDEAIVQDNSEDVDKMSLIEDSETPIVIENEDFDITLANNVRLVLVYNIVKVTKGNKTLPFHIEWRDNAYHVRSTMVNTSFDVDKNGLINYFQNYR